MGLIFGREPVFWVGVVASVIIAVLQTLVGSGVITASTQNTVVNLVTALLPIISALVARTFVTPVKKA